MQPKRPQKIDADDQIRDYYEHGSPSESEAFPEPMESIPTAAQRAGKLHWPDESIARLSGGDPDASPQGIDGGTETPGGSNPTPDQDLDEIGRAVGVTYQDNEPLMFEDKYAARDESRWELNPASSEDYQERQESNAKPVRPRSSSRKQGNERKPPHSVRKTHSPRNKSGS